MLKRTFLTAILSLFLGLVPVALVHGPAFAASSDGAQHLHDEGCPEVFFCYKSDQLINTVTNQNAVALSVHSDDTFTFFNGRCTSETTRSDSYNQLFKFDQGDQVFRYKRTQSELFFECGGEPAVICSFTETFVYANGAVRHEASDEPVCTPA